MRDPQSEPVEYHHGVPVARPTGAPLSWSWAHDRLVTAEEYWVASLSPRRETDVTLVHGVWHEDCLWFTVGAGSKMDRYLAHDPSCAASVVAPPDVMMLDGGTEPIADPDDLRLFGDLLAQKYETPRTVAHAGLAGAIGFRLVPRLALGSAEHASPTQWHFT